jgi:hypothetical protein
MADLRQPKHPRSASVEDRGAGWRELIGKIEITPATKP